MERLLAQTTVRVRAPAADRRSLPLLQHHGARPRLWYVLVPQTHSYSEVKRMFLEKQLDLEGDRMVTVTVVEAVASSSKYGRNDESANTVNLMFQFL